MPDDRQLLFQSGGYRKLKSFQLAQLCVDITESYYADSCRAVKFGKDKKITMAKPVNSKLECVQILFTPPGKVGRKSYTLAIPVDNWEILMITEATLNGELLIPQQILEQMLKIR